MNLTDVEETIKTLENSDNSLHNARNLASLYIIQDRMKSRAQAKMDNVESELQDVLPQYKEYKDIKKKFQMRLLPQTAVQRSMKVLCTEIKEFLLILYNNSDMQEERDCIQDMLKEVKRTL